MGTSFEYTLPEITLDTQTKQLLVGANRPPRTWQGRCMSMLILRMVFVHAVCNTSEFHHKTCGWIKLHMIDIT